MEYEEIYNLSKRFSPPKVDLRKAKILDDYGDEKYSKLQINHKKPDDVNREALEYYGWVYPFVEPEDLIFYLYAIIIEYKNNQNLECMESFMYSMDREISKLQNILSEEENRALINSFQIIMDLDEHDWSVWTQCKNLQKLIGISNGDS